MDAPDHSSGVPIRRRCGIMNKRGCPVSPIIRDAPNNDVSLVYFMKDRSGELIRIGFTGRDDLSKRLEEHRKNGYHELALAPGRRDDEKKIHEHFDYCRERLSSDRSNYRADEVMPYVSALLERNFAENDVSKAIQLSRVPWQEWSPQSLRK